MILSHGSHTYTSTAQEICEKEVMERKIEHCGGLSRNVAIGYCAGYGMSASSLTVKHANYPCVCMPIVDKSKRKSELHLCGRNKGVC